MQSTDREGARKLAAIVLIPARLAARRLPDKPLADVAGAPLIVQVLRRAVEAGVGPVVVACCDAPVAEVVTAAGGRAVMTDPDHPSGSDRIWEALGKVDPEGAYDTVLNLQGDLPTIPPSDVAATLDALRTSDADVATIAAEISNARDRAAPSVVKAIVSLAPGAIQGPALYFTRTTAPSGDGPHYHHIGIYAYRRQALQRFVALPPAPLEQRERLEQLRLLENGMRITCRIVETVPLGVDTPEDLEEARRQLGGTVAGGMPA
ncbi:MAG: 3-deoxy-manno-octulosonate cytidylyltransferase [Alphaproteobacteria bacterium]